MAANVGGGFSLSCGNFFFFFFSVTFVFSLLKKSYSSKQQFLPWFMLQAPNLLGHSGERKKVVIAKMAEMNARLLILINRQEL